MSFNRLNYNKKFRFTLSLKWNVAAIADQIQEPIFCQD